jgi:hypothetical protein
VDESQEENNSANLGQVEETVVAAADTDVNIPDDSAESEDSSFRIGWKKTKEA